MCLEIDVVERARAGDREALNALLAARRDRVFRYLLAMIGDEHQAEDLLQETFSRIALRIADLKDPARFSSWLLAAAVNHCRSHLRSLVRRPQIVELIECRDAEVRKRRSALSSIMGRETAELVALAIDRLPVLLREAFVLRHVEGLTYEEMEGIVDASRGTIQVRAHRARALLRRQLGDIVDSVWLRGRGEGQDGEQ